MCNTHCFSTAKMVRRTRKILRLYTHRLSCYITKSTESQQFPIRGRIYKFPDSVHKRLPFLLVAVTFHVVPFRVHTKATAFLPLLEAQIKLTSLNPVQACSWMSRRVCKRRLGNWDVILRQEKISRGQNRRRRTKGDHSHVFSGQHERQCTCNVTLSPVHVR